jgi:predicted DCC family thiol-disulfide oxidoreductase YuxK
MSETERDSNVPRPLKGWILYDRGCGFCFRWVHFWEQVVARRGFELKDLQSAEEERILQVPAENLLDDIRVLKVDGGLECGADEYFFCSKTYLVG